MKRGTYLLYLQSLPMRVVESYLKIFLLLKCHLSHLEEHLLEISHYPWLCSLWTEKNQLKIDI